MANKYTDENYLHMFFHHYLNNMYTEPDDVFKNMFCDGFEAPLDPDYLAPFMYDLADRLGYKLENNLWVEK